MPRKQVQPPEPTDELELQKGSPGADGIPALPEDAGSNTPDQTNQLPAGLDNVPPAAETEEPKESRARKRTSAGSGGASKRSRRSAAVPKAAEPESPVSERRARPAPPVPRIYSNDVLAIDVREDISSADDTEDAAWNEIYNAYHTRRFLTGTLSGVEDTETNKTIAVLDYKGLRVIVPMREMMLRLERVPTGGEYAPMMKRQAQVLSTMLGAELDFVVKGLDSKARAVVASRREAMLRKRQTFYMETNSAGVPRVCVGRVAQARVVAVAEKVVRVEVFGVECPILARDLSWDWIGDARERFSVGDKILVRIQEVNVTSLEDITIQADVRSVSNTTSRDRLKLCRVEGKYAGTVTDVRRGVVYIRLNNGVNAVAHTCYDYRMPGKKDTVSFAVTKLDTESGIAIGIITRIIKQNL